MNIVFLNMSSSANGVLMRQQPMGGTESAMISMAESLASRGHEVTIFSRSDELVCHAVHYKKVADFEYYANNHAVDVLICIRDLLVPLVRKWARVQIYFSPDSVDQPFLNSALTLNIKTAASEQINVGLFNLGHIEPKVDKIFCVGEWQKQCFLAKYKIKSDKIYVASNGVSQEFFFKSLPLPDRSKTVVYASTPYRGLQWLVHCWPLIKKRIPEARCQVMSGMQIYGQSDQADHESYGALYQSAANVGIELLGPLPKAEMADVFKRARVMAYPNTFAETFCMAVLEAQSCGLPVVSSDLAGLKERVTNNLNGYLIAGQPNELNYQKDFIDKTSLLLDNDSKWEAMSDSALHVASKYRYDKLSQEWEIEFLELLAQANPLCGYYKIDHDVRVQSLVNGYAKDITIKGHTMKNAIADALTQYGLVQTANYLRDCAEIGKNMGV